MHKLTAIFITAMLALTTGMLYADGKNCRTASDAELMGYKGNVKSVVIRTWPSIPTTPDEPKLPDDMIEHVRTITFDTKGAILSWSDADMDNHTETTRTRTRPSADSMVTTSATITPGGSDTLRERHTNTWISDSVYRQLHFIASGKPGNINKLQSSEMVTLDRLCRKVKAVHRWTDASMGKGIRSTIAYNGDSTVITINYLQNKQQEIWYLAVLKSDAWYNPTVTLLTDNTGEHVLQSVYEYY